MDGFGKRPLRFRKAEADADSMLNDIRHPPRIIVSYNCLLLPVAVVFWWYWTRRKARQVVSRLLVKFDGEHETEGTSTFDADEFSSW